MAHALGPSLIGGSPAKDPVARLSRLDSSVTLGRVHTSAVSRPPLDEQRLSSGSPPWAQVEVVEETPSTNALAARLARQGASHGLVIVAEHQTEGRGRLDRTWVSPPRAALTFSILVRPQTLPAQDWPWLPLTTGVGVVEGIVASGGPRCVLKWPNDVMYDGLKLAGLLAERVETPLGPAAVLGVGLNVSTLRPELPVPTASSLRLAGWTGVDRTTLLLGLLDTLGDRLGLAGRGLPSDAHAAYVSRCETLGQHVRVELPSGGVCEGVAVEIADDGGLIVDTADGRRTLNAGDVVHVRSGSCVA